MTHQRREEIGPGCRRSADHNVAEGFLFKMTVGDVVDQSDHSDNVALRIEVWREGAGFPNVPSLCRMPRNHDVVSLNNLAAQSTLQYVFESRRAQTWEHVHRHLAQYF